MATAATDRTDEDLEAAGQPPVAVAQETTKRPQSADAKVCSNCQQSLKDKNATVCPHCGYYFSLGICIELDQTWERLAGGPTPEPVNPRQEDPSKLQMGLVLEQVPSWGWTLLGCNVAVLGLSIFARVAVPDGFLRTLWCVTQLFAGIASFLTCHAIAYLISIAEDASMSMLDIVLKPIKLWKDVVRELPKRFYLVAAGSCGVTAVFGAIVIIGALNYEVLLEWGITAPPRRELMQAISQAQSEDNRGDNTPSGSAVDRLAGKTVEKNVRVDCVIVGYTVDPKKPNLISSLIVAREYNGSLKYVGSLTAGIPDQARLDLLEGLAEIPRDAPFVAVPPHINARWVRPESVCRVKCVGETKLGSLIEMEFEQLLGTVD